MSVTPELRVNALHDHIRLRRHRVDRWIEDQHSLQTDVPNNVPPPPKRVGTPCNPYLAYPHLNRAVSLDEEDEETLESYVLLEDEAIPSERSVDAQSESIPDCDKNCTDQEASRTSGTFPNSRPLWSKLSLGFNSARPPSSISGISSKCGNPSRDVSRSPIPENSRVFSDAESMRTTATTWQCPNRGHPPNPMQEFLARQTTPFPSFHTPSHRSRPSISSERTFTSQSSFTVQSSVGTTSAEHRSLYPPSSLLTRTSRIFKSSTPSLWSLPISPTHQRDPPGSTILLSKKPSFIRRPFGLKASTNMQSLGQSASFLSSSSAKRKKLVVRGVPLDDVQKLDGVKKWCESFGEVRKITRTQSGDLHIHFRRSDVADTVCRVRATVSIEGVGSVSLSWFQGKKP